MKKTKKKTKKKKKKKKKKKEKRTDKILGINIRISLHVRLAETRRASCIDNIPHVTVMLLVIGPLVSGTRLG